MSVTARPEVRTDPSQTLPEWKTDAVRVEDDRIHRNEFFALEPVPHERQ